MKINHWKLSKPGKNRGEGRGHPKQEIEDRGVNEKQGFLLLGGRFVFYKTFTQISSTKGESFA